MSPAVSLQSSTAILRAIVVDNCDASDNVRWAVYIARRLLRREMSSPSPHPGNTILYMKVAPAPPGAVYGQGLIRVDHVPFLLQAEAMVMVIVVWWPLSAIKPYICVRKAYYATQALATYLQPFSIKGLICQKTVVQYMVLYVAGILLNLTIDPKSSLSGLANQLTPTLRLVSCPKFQIWLSIFV